ncbi:flagellar basal body P-ring formation chaperone FlgA [Bryobacter aggregatus]|uniref:flagellar basal body P-ring formation chaperone FlgA n=1 Tax=Bryobacter aggregatus TaxID=360054 RepID=UPI0004E0E9B0|nr:flagellar basal body P-ring formation chaperone FlgA [Bryobacter aggregatus]
MWMLLIAIAIAPSEDCLVLQRAEIQAQDLAPRTHGFRTLPPATVLGFAPNYGVRRDLSPQTLSAWATKQGIRGEEFQAFCIYRAAPAAQRPWTTAISEALEESFRLKVDPASIEVIEERSAFSARGEYTLPKQGLSYDPRAGRYIWIGKLGATGLRIQFTMSAQETRWVAARSLLRGEKLQPTDLEEVSIPWRPASDLTLVTLASLEDQVLRNSLPKGTLLLRSHFTDPPLIAPGDAIEVISEAGRARIRVAAIARGKARLGESILVSTLEGKKLLRAVATGRGEARIASLTGRKPE